MVSYASATGRWVIVATVLGSGMAAIDGTVVGIALPVIGREFHASISAMQWVVTGYMLVLAALLIVGGTLGDQFGRRRVFSIGVAWFTLASLLCAVAPNVTFLVATRLLQGAGAALLVPGSLSIIEASFVPDDRGRAIGAWSGLGGVATAIGPLLGGYLISAASWRWIFTINVPIGLVVLAVSARHVPESRQSTGPGGVDLAGASATVIALAGITFGLIEGGASGWTSTPVLATLTLGAAAAALFVVIEGRSQQAMVPLGVFRERQFTVTNALTLIVYAGLGGALFSASARARSGRPLQPARRRALPPPPDRHHAFPFRPLRRARLADRTATPDERRPACGRGRTRPSRAGEWRLLILQ